MNKMTLTFHIEDKEIAFEKDFEFYQEGESLEDYLKTILPNLRTFLKDCMTEVGISAVKETNKDGWWDASNADLRKFNRDNIAFAGRDPVHFDFYWMGMGETKRRWVEA